MKFILQVFLALCGALALLALGGCDQSLLQSGKKLHEAIFESQKKNGQEGHDPNFGNETDYLVYDTGISVEFRNKNLFWINNNVIFFNERTELVSENISTSRIIPAVLNFKEKSRYPVVDNFNGKLNIKCKLKDNFYYLSGSLNDTHETGFGKFVFDGEKYSFVNSSLELNSEMINIASFGGMCVARLASKESNVKEVIYLPEIAGKIKIFFDGSVAFLKVEEKKFTSDIAVPNVYWYTLGYSEMLRAYYVTGSDQTSLEQMKLVANNNKNTVSDSSYYNILMNENGLVEILEISNIPTKNIPKIAEGVWTSGGLVLRASLKRGNDEAGQIEGLYLWSSENGFIRVIEGVVGEYTVSPNGCLMAIDHFSKEDASRVKRANPTLKIINYCR